eukprot:6208378-Pleurochrysis_carterae.AAC.1
MDRYVHSLRIAVPLVWRYSRVPGKQRVLIQFKPSLGDHGTFFRSEWGPWITQKATRNNSLGAVEEVE